MNPGPSSTAVALQDVPLWRRAIDSEFFVLGLAILYFLLLAPVAPGFATTGNLANVFSSLLPLVIVAVGQTIVLITGGIDLSVTSTIALASTVGALLMTGDRGVLAGHPAAVPVTILAMLAIGCAVGVFNGAAITALRMPPFIVTLTSMMFLSGLAIWLTQSRNIYHLPESFTTLGRRLPVVVTVTLVIALLAHWMLQRCALGRWIFAVGRNARAAQVSGVPVARTTIAAYAMSGFCAAAASILYTARLETGSPVLGQRILLDVIGATVIGGTSLFGGRGKVLWTVYGVLFMTLIDNSLNLLGLSLFMVLMAKGSVILFAAMLDAARSRRAG